MVALLSYHSRDPSLNIVTDFPVQNLAGYPGSVVSDILLQTIGAASTFIVLCVITRGWRVFSNKKPLALWKTLALLCPALIFASVWMSFIDPPLKWPIDTGLGGAVGAVTRVPLLEWFPPWLIIVVSAVGFLLLWMPATGLSTGEWNRIIKGSGTVGAMLSKTGSKLLAFRRSRIKRSAKNVEKTSFWHRLKTPFSSEESNQVEPEKTFKRRTLAKKPKKEPEVEAKEQEAKSTTPASRIKSKKTEQQTSLSLQRKEGDYELPGLELLKKPKKTGKFKLSESALEQNARMLESVLHDFGVKGDIVGINPGPVVTLYELEPSPGTKSSRVIGLSDDIARSMSAISARISVIPGRNALGIELPNSKRETVYFRDLLEEDDFANTTLKLPMALGKDIGGAPIMVDLARMPHLLVAGTTGSGKSVSVNGMIASLLYALTPEECKFIMIDPKMLELSVYEGIPHLLSPVVTEPGKAVVALKWTVKEMENRYRLMANLGVRNVDGYNKRIKAARAKGEELKRTVQTGFDPETGKPVYEEQPLDMNPLPFIVVVVDEMADLMLQAGKDIESSIQRLAQMARAAGIHIIMATQRPSVDVITGVIKANFPTRISFQVSSRIDSRTILGDQGAEQLLGMGDMLYMAGGGRLTRVHGPFISDQEIDQIVSYLKTQAEPEYVEDVTLEPEEGDASFEFDATDEEQVLYQKAVAIVKRDNKASTSYIQRQLKIGYNRAARLIEQMEKEGVVSQATSTGKREVLAGV